MCGRLEPVPDFSILLTIVRMVLGVILLSSVKVDPNYLRIGNRENIFAGMGQFNVSLSNYTTPDFVPLWFTMQITSLLQDPRTAIQAPMTSDACQEIGDECVAYILPGELAWVKSENDSTASLVDDNYPDDAMSFVVEDAVSWNFHLSRT